MTQQLMIAVDGSAPSLEAVRRAMALIQGGLKAHVALVHVQQAASLLELATRDADAIAEAAVEAGEHLMTPAMALLDAQGIGYSTEVVLGEAAEMLVDMAEQLQADMLIVGAQGLGAVRSALFGSVSRAVLQHCTVPVLVVRESEPLDVPAEDDSVQA